MKTERSVAMCIILSIVTCGLYSIYWFICLTDDVNAIYGTPNATSGGMAFLFNLITCGIYGLYWAYKQGEKLDEMKYAQGLPSGNSKLLYLLLSVCGLSIITYALMQDSLNKLS